MEEERWRGWKFQSCLLDVEPWRKCIRLGFQQQSNTPPSSLLLLLLLISHILLSHISPSWPFTPFLFPSPISEQRGGASATCDIPTGERGE